VAAPPSVVLFPPPPPPSDKNACLSVLFLAVALQVSLDYLTVDSDVLVLVAALQNLPLHSPHPPLRSRVCERVKLLYHPTGFSEPSLVVARSPHSSPNAYTLAAVEFTWFPSTGFAPDSFRELLPMAVALWRPNTPSSRFSKFQACLSAITRLSSLSPTRTQSSHPGA